LGMVSGPRPIEHLLGPTFLFEMLQGGRKVDPSLFMTI